MNTRQIATLCVLGALSAGVLALAVAPVVPGGTSGATSVTSVAADGAFDPSGLVGMSETAATTMAKQAGWVVRVAMRDGESFALTADYSPTRVNLTVEDGEVRGVMVG